MTAAENPADPSRGLFRVSTGFGIAAVGFITLFLGRLQELRPNWLILGFFVLVLAGFAPKQLKDLAMLQAGTASEKRGTVFAIFGALFVAVPLIYLSWRFGPTAGMRIVDTYLPPLLGLVTGVFASVAFYVERKNGLRVYVGNRGWVFVSRKQPSNPIIGGAAEGPRTPHRDR